VFKSGEGVLDRADGRQGCERGSARRFPGRA
jgi:hypothetical protein